MMKGFRWIFLFFLSLVIPATAWAVDMDIRAMMSEEEFTNAGLEKLSPEELASLNKWLEGRIEFERKEVLEETIPEGEEAFGIETVPSRVVEILGGDAPENIESYIRLDAFRGWRGNTVFELENGQVWKQTDGKRFIIRPVANPRVTIRKGMLGTYFLKIEGYGSNCKVQRIK